MLNLTLAQIAEIVEGNLIGAGHAIVQSAVSDSRQAKEGLLFVALKGERVDGHDYAQAALNNGAAAVLAERELPGLEPQIVVRSCRRALAELARFQLARYPVRIVAVTGSMGKTSCKDLIATVLGSRFTVLKNEGNMNTEVTLPMTLFGLEPEHQVAVLEMGMVAQGEIRELCEIAPPDYALITNILPVHLESLGSIEAIAATKGEIFASLKPDGTALVNRDDPLVVEQAQRFSGQSLSYGIVENAHMTAAEIQNLGREGSRFTAVFPDGSEKRLFIPLPGEHMVHNALPALLAGHLFGLSNDEIATALAAAEPSRQRLHIRELSQDRLLIDDSYNANPRSVEAALKMARELRGSRPLVLVLGDMLELGELSLDAHREVGRLAAELQPQLLITRGERAEEIGCEALRVGLAAERLRHVNNNESALALLREHLPAGAVILVKGSRGMQMERIVAGLEAMS